MRSNELKFAAFCDRVIFFALCGCIFVLPAAIAYLNSFAVLAIFFYLLKKIQRIILDWPAKTRSLNFLGKLTFIWKSFAPPANILDGPLQWVALAFFISVVLSQYPMLSLTAFFGKFGKSVFLYFSFIETVSEKKHLKIFLGFFLLSALIAALSGVYQHYTGRDFLKHIPIGLVNNIPTGRISSMFPQANAFAIYLLPVIGLVMHLLSTAFSRHQSWMVKVALAVFLGLLMFCLCWTFSRSAWIGFLVIVVSMVSIDWHKFLFAGFLLFIFGLVFLPCLAQVRDITLFNDNGHGQESREGLAYSLTPNFNDAGSGRLLFWKNAFSIFCTSPIWGTGFNTYTRVIERNPDKSTWWYAHNCYLQLAAETGILGLGAFLGMLFVLLTYGIRNCETIHDPWVLSVVQGCVCGLIGFLVQSFFDNTFYTVQLGMLMWIMFGLMVASMRLKNI